MSPEQQNDILSINKVQLLLSEKRTALSVMRTGIAVLALPLSIFSALIATSRWYNVMEVWPLLVLVVAINLGLAVFGIYLIARSMRRMRQYDRLIADINWGSDIFYPLTGTTKKWPESFNNADFGHFTD